MIVYLWNIQFLSVSLPDSFLFFFSHSIIYFNFLSPSFHVERSECEIVCYRVVKTKVVDIRSSCCGGEFKGEAGNPAPVGEGDQPDPPVFSK